MKNQHSYTARQAKGMPKKTDIYTFSLKPCGFGHYEVTAHSFDPRVNGISWVTTHMPDVDTYRFDDGKRREEVIRSWKDRAIEEYKKKAKR